MTADYPRPRGVRPPTAIPVVPPPRRSRLARWSRLWPALYAIAAYAALTAAYVAVLAWLFTVIA